MFSGIIECTSAIIKVRAEGELIHLTIRKPLFFDDLSVGDSVSVNGVCLTVEKFDDSAMEFSLGPETLQITGWNLDNLAHRTVNLERALAVNSRLHGHWVTGHIDEVCQVLETKKVDESLYIRASLSENTHKYVWKKGSVTLNGVSLTVNEVTEDWFSVWLIPETLKVTNLGKVQDKTVLNLEYDLMARGIVNCFLKGLTPYTSLDEVMVPSPSQGPAKRKEPHA